LVAHAHNKVAAKVTIAFFTVLEFHGVQGWIELEELTHHGTAVIHALDPQFEEPEGLPVLAGQAPAMIVEKVERVRQALEVGLRDRGIFVLEAQILTGGAPLFLGVVQKPLTSSRINVTQKKSDIPNPSRPPSLH
jgi:hypothetical protein